MEIHLGLLFLLDGQLEGNLWKYRDLSDFSLEHVGNLWKYREVYWDSLWINDALNGDIGEIIARKYRDIYRHVETHTIKDNVPSAAKKVI